MNLFLLRKKKERKVKPTPGQPFHTPETEWK